MNIDNCWLADDQLAYISTQQPSTSWGAELIGTTWPKRYPTLLSSETYRGCATVLSLLLSLMHQGISVRQIQMLVENLDQSLKASQLAQTANDMFGGAGLTIVNAWTTAAELGFTSQQIAAAYESELIYVAKMFIHARQQGV